jgi:DnaJ-class molecular chaperone
MALGDEVEVTTLEGKSKLKIPAGTQNGHILTLKGQGIPHLGQNSKKGDHHIQVEVTIPKHVSSEEKKLLTRLLELEHDKYAKAANNKQSSDFLGKMKEAFSGS